jgi:hypothetical protein
MYISKKELLSITGISYGQLYRWKRERLIPEEWFIKQSSFTGQETFFPRDLILNRIKAIQELKDRYSLEELAKLLSPQVGERDYPTEELKYIEDIDNELISIFEMVLNSNSFSYIEVIVMVILSRLKIEYDLSSKQIEDILNGLKTNICSLKTTEYIFGLYKILSDFYTIIYQEQVNLYLDERIELVKKIRMDDISNDLKIKYKDYFDVGTIDIKQNTKNDNDENSNKPNYDNQKNNNDCDRNNNDYDKQNNTYDKQNNAYDNQNTGYSKQNNDNDKQGYRKSKQNNEYEYNKQNNGDDIVLKINNWEVRL